MDTILRQLFYSTVLFAVTLPAVALSSEQGTIRANLIHAATSEPFVVPEGTEAYLDCYQNNHRVFTEYFTAGASSLEVDTNAGEYMCTAWVKNYSQDGKVGIIVASGQTTTLTYSIVTPSSSVTFHFVDGVSGDAWTTPLSGSVQCNDNEAGKYFSAIFTNEAESITVPLRDGSYECTFAISGSNVVTHSPIELLGVEKNQQLSREQPVLIKDSTLSLRVVDIESGLLIDETVTANIEVTSNTPIRDSRTVQVNNGSATLSMVGGLEYKVSLSSPFTPLESATYSIPRNESQRLLFESNKTKQLELSLQATQSKITVRLALPSGDPVTFGEVDAFTPPQDNVDSSSIDSQESTDVFYSANVKNGVTYLPVLPNKEYRVRFTPTNFAHQYFPPKIQTVTVGENETVTLDLDLKGINKRVNVNFIQEKGVFTSSRCEAFTENEDWTHSDGYAYAGATVDLLIEDPTVPWTIWCDSVSKVGNTKKQFYGRAVYLPQGDGEWESVQATMSDRGEFYDPQTYTFDSQTGAAFVLPDGDSIITIPAGAMGEAGTVTMTAASASDLLLRDANFPLLTYDIKFFQNGRSVPTANAPVMISYPIDAAYIEELGISSDELPSVLHFGSYDPVAKLWRRDALNASYNAETKRIEASVTHFSIWSNLLDIAEGLLDEESDPEPTATPQPTATEEPTATPNPSATPEPTATPTPGDGPTPAPNPAPEQTPSPAPTAIPIPHTPDDIREEATGGKDLLKRLQPNSDDRDAIMNYLNELIARLVQGMEEGEFSRKQKKKIKSAYRAVNKLTRAKEKVFKKKRAFKKKKKKALKALTRLGRSM